MLWGKGKMVGFMGQGTVGRCYGVRKSGWVLRGRRECVSVMG